MPLLKERNKASSQSPVHLGSKKRVVQCIMHFSLFAVFSEQEPKKDKKLHMHLAYFEFNKVIYSLLED